MMYRAVDSITMVIPAVASSAALTNSILVEALISACHLVYTLAVLLLRRD